MTIARCDATIIAGRLIAAMDAATAARWTTSASSSDDNRRNNFELHKATNAADAQVCKARASTLGDGYRSLFLSLSASISHGGVIPDHLGALEQVTIKYATTDSVYRAGKFDKDVTLADIENWRGLGATLYGGAHDSGIAISGFYLELSNQLFYTGADAKIQLANFTRKSRQVVDAAITSGLKVLTSATAAFTAADVGSAVVIDGAAANGDPLASVIDTHTNATTVSIRDAAGATVSAKLAMIAQCQSPEVDEDTVFGLALGNLVKEGDRAPFMAIAVGDARRQLAEITGGRMEVQPLEAVAA
jgi:hypothetical protein